MLTMNLIPDSNRNHCKNPIIGSRQTLRVIYIKTKDKMNNNVKTPKLLQTITVVASTVLQGNEVRLLNCKYQVG